jgi:hypothetical protein
VAHRSEPRFLVLHTVRVKGYAESSDVAAAAGLPAVETEEHLRGLADDGLVRWQKGPLPPWSPTQAGRTEHQRLVAEEFEASGAKAVGDDGYRRFLVLNRELKKVCTAWQLRDGDPSVPNDHSDPAYEREVLDRLEAVDRGVQTLLAELAAQLGRYERYGARLRTALERVAGGEHQWVTRPIIDSYHTVWMELHEDLLVTLGLARGNEEEET